MIQINKKLIPELDYGRSKYLGQNPDIDGYRDKSGIYGIYGCTKTPNTGIGVLEVLVYSGDWVLQRFTNIETGNMWQRTFISGATWTDWVQRW